FFVVCSRLASTIRLTLPSRSFLFVVADANAGRVTARLYGLGDAAAWRGCVPGCQRTVDGRLICVPVRAWRRSPTKEDRHEEEGVPGPARSPLRLFLKLISMNGTLSPGFCKARKPLARSTSPCWW